MFREFKEYKDIVKLYQNNVYQSEEDIIKEAFASEKFTKEESVFIEENFDALIEQVIGEETLSEQPTTSERMGRAFAKNKDKIPPKAKIRSVSFNKGSQAVDKFKSALGKVGSKIKDVAKTAVKTGTAPLKSGQGAGKMVGKGAKLLSKMGPAGKAAAVATLAGGAIAAGLAARNKTATSKQVDKYVERNKGSKPIRKIDPAPFNRKEKSSTASTAGQAAAAGAQAADSKAATSSTPVVSDKTKQGKPRTKAQMMAAKRIAAGKTIQQVKDENKASMKAKAEARFKAFKAKRAGKTGEEKPVQKVETKPAPTPSGDKLKAGSFGISQKGKEQAAMNKGEVAAKKTNIPSGDKLKAGSFGISKKGKEQAAVNKAELAKKKASNTVPSGSFGISAKGKEQAAANKAEASKKKPVSGNTSAMNVSSTKKITQGEGGGTENLTKSAGSLEANKKKAAKMKELEAKRNAMEKEFEIPESKQYDAYDLVLEYLLSSEQVATIEEANYVMTEMDAETIQSIVEEQKKNFDEGLAGMALKTGLAIAGGVLAKKGLDKAKKGFDNFLNNQRGKGFGGNKRVDDTRQNSGDKKVGEKIYYGK